MDIGEVGRPQLKRHCRAYNIDLLDPTLRAWISKYKRGDWTVIALCPSNDLEYMPLPRIWFPPSPIRLRLEKC